MPRFVLKTGPEETTSHLEVNLIEVSDPWH